MLREEKQDLFQVDTQGRPYYLAHCISADFKLGAGIAVQFDRRFDMRSRLCSEYPGYRLLGKGDCLAVQVSDGFVQGVFNLVTKDRYFEKPTIESLRTALCEMAYKCTQNNIQLVVMPRIGCGLDRLKWPEVRTLIEDTFAHLPTNVLVCSQ